jgi:hypothetical protein
MRKRTQIGNYLQAPKIKCQVDSFKHQIFKSERLVQFNCQISFSAAFYIFQFLGRNERMRVFLLIILALNVVDALVRLKYQ